MRADAGSSADVESNGRWIQNTATIERWLLITNSGGQVLETLADSTIPASMRSAPGPLRHTAKLGGQMEKGNGAHLPKYGAQAAGLLSSFITYQILYYDSDSSAFLPVETAYVAIRACTKDPQKFFCDPEDFEEAEVGFTDDDGYFSFACQGDEYEGDASTYTPASVQVINGVVAIPNGSTSTDCGQSFQAVLPSSHAKVFINIMKARAGASDLFGASRSWIKVYLTSSGNKSFYDPTDDEITILTSHVWDAYGVFVAAHEYGHAYHADALYGNVASGTCPSPHHMDTESNLSCAYSEGFADYFSVSVRGDLQSFPYRDLIESNNNFPGCVSRTNGACTGGTSTEGALIEGAFAAMLYDLSDSAVEPHDSIAAPGSYVRELIRTCEVYYSSWRRANGPDEIIYCAENAIAPGGYLTPRGATPSAYSEAASEEGGWSSSRVRSNWEFNLYEKP